MGLTCSYLFTFIYVFVLVYVHFLIAISQSAINLHERAWTTFAGTCFLFVWEEDQLGKSKTHNGRVTPLSQRK